MSRLWYKKPSEIWEEAMPLGNGRIGACVFGTLDRERIQVNEESIWYGGPVDRNNPSTLENLPKIRQLLFDGRIQEAEQLMMEAMSGCPCGMHPYQILGDIILYFPGFGEVQDYMRDLDLDTALATVSFVSEGKKYKREAFISKPADCMVIHLSSENGGRISFTAELQRSVYFDGVGRSGDREISLWGNLGKGGSDFAMSLYADTVEGKAYTLGEHLIVEDAREVTLYFSADSTFHYEKVSADATGMLRKNLHEKLMAAKAKGVEQLRAEHIADYQSLFERCSFTLDCDPSMEKIPTDERIQKVSENNCDLGLQKLYFDYGRYLMIACSREGGLPSTLQGLWNKDLTPPWESKYTININTEMNYWPAEVCNLSECHMPLFDHIERMVENGRRTARVMYGCRGFVAHHNTDIHGDTAPQDKWIPGTYWVMGAAWLCTHQWTHYEYTKDLAFLQRTYPVMAEAALFFLDFLVEHNGYLVTCPSVSPENTYILPSGEMGANGFGVTMDNQILRDLFQQCMNAFDILKEQGAISEALLQKCEEAGITDLEAFTSEIKKASERLCPTKISERGTILEWQEDYKEWEPGHRHISHLYGLHPSRQITMDKTPELAKAAGETLKARLSQGGGHTGWSRAWIINHYAKLWDGDKALENIVKLLENSTYPNMFDKHPPFQIDGNFGATAAIAEMIVQSSPERIVLLPALPKKWEKGEMTGLRVVGNGEVSIRFENHSLHSMKLIAYDDIDTDLLYKNQRIHISVKKGEEIQITPECFK